MVIIISPFCSSQETLKLKKIIIKQNEQSLKLVGGVLVTYSCALKREPHYDSQMIQQIEIHRSNNLNRTVYRLQPRSTFQEPR